MDIYNNLNNTYQTFVLTSNDCALCQDAYYEQLQYTVQLIDSESQSINEQRQRLYKLWQSISDEMGMWQQQPQQFV